MNERRTLLDRYRGGYVAVVSALEGVDLDVSSGGGWTPRQVVHHLADATLTAAVRLRRILAEDAPHIAGYDEETYARILHYDRPIDTSLDLLRTTISSSTELLDALDPHEWDRSGHHDEFGPYSVDLWLERQAAHVHEHAEQIREAAR